MSEQPKSLWQYTEEVGDRIVYNPLYEEADINSREGYYKGKQIIARDTPINGGVYLGVNKNEGIVVDDLTYPKELNEAYQEAERWFFKNPISRMFKPFRANSIFDLVYKISDNKFGGEKPLRDLDFEIGQIQDEIRAEKGKSLEVYEYNLIPLNKFMQKRAGVCRHQALLAAYLIERLIQNRKMEGQLSIDRNMIPDKGGHAWVRFQDPAGEITIIDPAQHFVGNINNTPKGSWDYKRPTDTK